jgi:hypothetical protein
MIYTYLRFHLGTPLENQVVVHTASLISNMMTMMMMMMMMTIMIMMIIITIIILLAL